MCDERCGNFPNPLIFFAVSVDIVYIGGISPPTHVPDCLMGIGADMHFAYRLLFLFRSMHEYGSLKSGDLQNTLFELLYHSDAYDTKYNYRFD